MSRRGFRDPGLIARNREIGQVLRKYRERRGLSVKECAAKIDVAARHYSALELGNANIYAAYADALAEFLDIPPQLLWVGRGASSPSVEYPPQPQWAERGAGDRVFVLPNKVDGGKLWVGFYVGIDLAGLDLEKLGKSESDDPETSSDS